jgi:hypothetical protein
MTVQKPQPTHPLTQIIIDLYGTQVEFAKRHKISRPTAKKYMDTPESMPFRMVVKLCKSAKMNVKFVTKKGEGENE